MKKLLQYQSEDNVLIALMALQPGDALSIDGRAKDFTCLSQLPMGHKIAKEDIKKGDLIRKFGIPIGIAKSDICRGEHVHVHNVADLISDWRSNYGHTYNPTTVRELDDSFRLADLPNLYGYRRRNGMVGFRNYLLVLSTVVCANQPVEELGMRYRDIVAVPNPSGCVVLPNEVERLKAILLGLARNPNVGAVIFCGLGCEAVDAEWFYNQVKYEKPAAFVRIQTEGSCGAALNSIEKTALMMREALAKEQRVEVSVSDIRFGTKCGGSDWTTAAVSNPIIGYASDIIVKNGGISLLGETTGWFGGEEFFIRNARSKAVADKILSLMDAIYNRAMQAGRRIEEGNPTPGNIEGGITTLTEKAIGNVKKGGTAPIEGVLDVGECPAGHGLYLVDNPGLDPISLLGLTCSSANVLVYSTGRGSPVGTPVAPSIKITGSPDALELFAAHMDTEFTGVLSGKLSIEEAGCKLFAEVVAVCNGKQVVAEQGRHREFAFPLLMTPM